MELLIQLFGEGKDLNVYQMSLRAIVIYFIALALIRISGRRTFGKKSTFDNTITIILGAILSRAVVGASPFLPTIICSLALVLLHRGIGWLTNYSKAIEKIVKGNRRILYTEGKIDQDNLKKCLMTIDELMSDVRLNTNMDSLEHVHEIWMETNGKVSVVIKKNNA
jgi:uncharacterized membrane protein YcaP (DUF421 family)